MPLAYTNICVITQIYARINKEMTGEEERREDDMR